MARPVPSAAAPERSPPGSGADDVTRRALKATVSGTDARRDLVKVAFNMLLNSSRRNGARHELAHHPLMARALVRMEGEKDNNLYSFRIRPQQTDPLYFQGASEAADQLIEAILTKHDAIRTMFFSGAGLRLQRRDSDIAEGVMGSMRRHGIGVLPVHDSFIAPISKAALLEQAMIEEAAKHGVLADCKRSPIVSAA